MVNERLKDRVAELIEDKNLSVKEAVKEIGINVNSICYYWNSDNITLDSLEKLALYFHCSYDYLLCRSNIMIDYIPSSVKTTDLAERIKRIFKENRKSIYQLTRTTPIQYSHFNRWKKGQTPSVNSLIVIADFLDVSVDYLTGRDA